MPVGLFGLAKKTILTREEYQKKADDLRKKVIDFRSQRRASLDKIAVQRAEARKKLLNKIDPILNNYIKENDISLIIDKKMYSWEMPILILRI